MTRPLHAWTSHHFQVALPEHHRFPIAKYGRLVGRLVEQGVIDRAGLHHSDPAPLEWLAAAHDPSYVDRVVQGRMDAAEVRALGLPWSPELVARARAAVFGTVCAARAALVHGVAGNLAGGSHHAARDRAGGYCLFNDLSVAIALLRDDGSVRRPFVIDLDVHQGDGTAAIFAGIPEVFTFSIHGRNNYPRRKVAGSFDLGMADGCGDHEYLAALERHLPAALDRHRPDLVLYQAGVDALREDALGQLAMTVAGLATRDARVFEWCEARGLPVVVTLGGGYARPLEPTITAHAGVWRAARAARERRPAAHGVDTIDTGVDGSIPRVNP